MVLEKRCENSRIAYTKCFDFAFIRESFSLFRESYAFIRGCFELIRESSALLHESEKKYLFFLSY